MKRLGFFLFFLPSLLYSQQKEVIHFQTSTDSVTVDSVLQIIHEAGVIQLSYDPSIIPQTSVLLEQGEWTSLSLLNIVSANTQLKYRKVGKNYILLKQKEKGKKTITVSGQVLDQETGEHLIGASVRIIGTTQGVITNGYGFYSLEIPPEKDSIEVSYLGYQTRNYTKPSIDQTLDVSLYEQTSVLKEVVIKADEEDLFNSPQFGNKELKANELLTINGTLGERDALRQLQQTAGVNMTSESSANFSVRGARPNQNLILLDEAVIYNPTHFVGFYSLFNEDALNKIDFYKGGIPSRYGGRLASITNIMMKEGNNQKFSGSGNINPLAGSLSVQGPLKKEKGSFILSGRYSFPDVYFDRIDAIRFFFYDVNLKMNYKLGPKDRIYISGYLGEDTFRVQDENFDFKWGNTTLTARWNHIFNQKLFLNTSYIFSQYDYNLRAGGFDQNLDWFTQLGNHTLKADFNYFANNTTKVNFGLNTTFHEIAPAFLSFENLNNPSFNNSRELNKNKGLENALYVELEKEVTPKLSILSGVRLSSLHNVGPGTQFIFNEEFENVGTIERNGGEFYHTNFNVEPRLSASYKTGELSSLKFGYTRTVQYISQASNSLSGSPLDVWFLSSPNVEPQRADQWSLGYFKKINNGKFDFSAETYFRRTNNEIDFKDNADLLLNDELEGELRVGTARSYGLELSLNKNQGKFTGNINFTLSRSILDIPLVNRGESYASSYDRPVNLSINPAFAINKRKRFTATWAFFSGLPFTSPTGRFSFGDVVVPSFSNRNEDRLPFYHRLDIGYEIEGKNRKNRRFHGSWSFAVFNVYNRKNANLITFRSVEGTNRSEAVKWTVFGFVPSVTYRFKF